MPALTRASPVQRPARVATAGVLERLRAFLKPEIASGLVEVLGTEESAIVRLRGQGLFTSGNAAVLPRALPVLERVAVALRAEAGAIEVIGYTDNEPIRTVRFPSNFELSAARAEAARAVLGRGTAEGRADADPIAPNTTAEGRDANRRIEILLRRQG